MPVEPKAALQGTLYVRHSRSEEVFPPVLNLTVWHPLCGHPENAGLRWCNLLDELESACGHRYRVDGGEDELFQSLEEEDVLLRSPHQTLKSAGVPFEATGNGVSADCLS